MVRRWIALLALQRESGFAALYQGLRLRSQHSWTSDQDPTVSKRNRYPYPASLLRCLTRIVNRPLAASHGAVKNSQISALMTWHSMAGRIFEYVFWVPCRGHLVGLWEDTCYRSAKWDRFFTFSFPWMFLQIYHWTQSIGPTNFNVTSTSQSYRPLIYEL